MKFLKIVIFCTLSLNFSLHIDKCSAQYILGNEEAPDNYNYQVLLKEKDAIDYVFADCDQVIDQALKLTLEDKKSFHDKYCIKIKENDFKIYTGLNDGKIKRYAIILDCMACFRPITFMLSIDPNGKINDLNVMIYRELRGGEVTNRYFLDKFKNKNIDSIDTIDLAVTGATSSAQCLYDGTKEGLLILKEFFLYKKLNLNKRETDAKVVTSLTEKEDVQSSSNSLTSFTQMRFINETPLIINIWHRSEQYAVTIMEKVFAEMKRVNKLIIKEGKKFNKKGVKKALEYPEEFTTLITHCKKFSEETNGLFDITLSSGDRKASFRDIKIEGNRLSMLDKKTRIDLNLVREAYLVDIGLDLLKSNNIDTGAINFGDSTGVTGKLSDDKDWEIGIRYLEEKDLILGYVKGVDKPLSVTVNPNYNKLNSLRTTDSNKLTNRITGMTVAASQWASVVCANSALESSVLSYVLFVGGQDQKIFSANKSPDIEYALIYDGPDGSLEYKGSKKMVKNLNQKISKVSDYKEMPACRCSVKP